MTTQQLREHFNNEFGMNPWPATYEVDHETYANVCQDLFTYMKDKHAYTMVALGIFDISVHIGHNNGIFFKNVELILKR